MPTSPDKDISAGVEARKQGFASYFSGVSPSELKREGESAFMSAMLAPVVAATYWLDPGRRGKPYTARIKFSGRRLGVRGRLGPGDRFEQTETVPNTLPGTGPISITARARDVEPGEWLVTAEVLDGTSKRPKFGRDGGVPQAAWPAPSRLGALLHWGTPKMSVSLPAKVRTSLSQLAYVPGSITGAWPLLVGLGVVVGVLLQQLLLQREHIDSRPILAVTLAALVAGALGAKLWYLAVSREVTTASLTDGLCIQGFLAGAGAVLLGGLLVLHQPVGTFVDVTAPGVFLGMAIGRQGCFFTGCCAGRVTASRWGVWASDRRIGARRIPVQLWEAGLALVIGAATLGLVVASPLRVPGAVALGGLAAYTLGRQLLLPFRVVPRRTSLGRNTTLAFAGLIVLADVACWIVVCI